VKSISHGVLVMNPCAELLLCHATGGRHWDIPKGMAIEGESSADAALRETREECGLALERADLHDLGRFRYRPDKDLSLHAALVPRFETSSCVCSAFFTDRWGRLRPEMDDFRWAAFDDVASLCARNMARVLTETLTLRQILASLRDEPAAPLPAP
jgi:8-oxo-dGTP pyrophosphatase MutT (NUDIX family)